jgi:erythromycin esterase
MPLSAATALAAVTAAMSLVMPAEAAQSAPRPDPVQEWFAEHASPVTRAALSRSIGTASVVGLGEAVHGAHEQFALKARVLRYLVEHEGFRSIAWEEDWTTGLRIDDYVTDGRGHPRSLVSGMTGQWRSREMVRLLRWLRAFNVGRPGADRVRFVGIEYYYTGPAAYDAVRRAVAVRRPDLLPRVDQIMRTLRPPSDDMEAYVESYMGLPDTSAYVALARELWRTVRRLPHGGNASGDPAFVHHARQILSFHEHFALPFEQQDDYREERAASNLGWWRHHTRHKVVYWAATQHTAAAPRLRIAVPGPDFRYAATGSWLQERLGRGYLSIGFTLGRGEVGLAPDEVMPLGPPDPVWFETAFRGVQHPRMMDLRRPAPPPVRHWLDQRLRTRGLPHAGPESFVTGGPLSAWYDVLVHVPTVTPTRGLD